VGTLSDDSAICYVLLVFVNDIMFSRNGASGPETKTLCVFELIAGLLYSVAQQDVNFAKDSYHRIYV